MYQLSFYYFTIFSFILLFSSSCSNPKTSEEKAINVVYIMADDLGYGELGVYGQKIIETPRIDQLAREGILFSQFYSGSPVCAPSRCILLTGMHSGHAYIRGNDEWGSRGDVWDFDKMRVDPGLEGQRPIPDSVVTVAELFKNAGYATGCVGKWGLGAPGSEGDPNMQGFDFFYGYNCQRQAHTYYPPHLWKNQEKIILDNDFVKPNEKLPEGADPNQDNSFKRFSLTSYAPELMHQEALSFIHTNRDNPFFLYYATPIPHAPLQAPESWVNHYQKKLGEEQPYLGERSYFPNRTPRATYAAMVSYLDEQVGEIIDTLEKLGLSENTIIMFTSDNGPTYNGGTDSPFFNSGGPFSSIRGRGKGYLYEGGIRVPMIVKWNGTIDAGQKSDHIAASWDFFATVDELLNNSGIPQTDGISFLPVLTGNDQVKPREYLYWEFPEYNGHQAIRLGNYKGVRQNMQDGNLEIELYDLSIDHKEENNISDLHPSIIAKMEHIFSEEHQKASIERFHIKAID